MINPEDLPNIDWESLEEIEAQVDAFVKRCRLIIEDLESKDNSLKFNKKSNERAKSSVASAAGFCEEPR